MDLVAHDQSVISIILADLLAKSISVFLCQNVFGQQSALVSSICTLTCTCHFGLPLTTKPPSTEIQRCVLAQLQA